jgi:hypothetical protein
MSIQACDQNGSPIQFTGEFTFSCIIEKETVGNCARSKKAQLLADHGSYAAQNEYIMFCKKNSSSFLSYF